MAAEEGELSEVLYLMLGAATRDEFRQKLENKPSLTAATSTAKIGSMTLLHFAARNGDVESIKVLIENGADPSYAGGYDGKQTALHYAAMKSYFFAVYFTLLIKSLSGKDFTPLLMVVLPKSIFPELKLTLQQTLQKITLETFESSLWQALEQSSPEIFSFNLRIALENMQVKMKEQPQLKTIANLIEIIQHSNEASDFILLLGQVLNRIAAKISSSFFASAIIHPSSPIYSSQISSSNEASLGESDLDEDSIDFDTAPRHRRRNSFP